MWTASNGAWTWAGSMVFKQSLCGLLSLIERTSILPTSVMDGAHRSRSARTEGLKSLDLRARH